MKFAFGFVLGLPFAAAGVAWEFIKESFYVGQQFYSRFLR